jgi:hypothetical protein
MNEAQRHLAANLRIEVVMRESSNGQRLAGALN